jgi:hypothetical protein
MIYTLKLKPDRDITGLLPAFFSLIIAGLAAAIFGPSIAITALGAVILLYSFFAFIAVYRTKCIGYTVSSFYMLFFSLYLFSLRVDEYSRKVLIQTHASRFFIVLTLALLIVLIYMLATKKVKWRGREILELAAFNVEEDSNTYTDRPRPVKKVELTRDQVNNFAAFLLKNLVVMPYYEQERILFVPVKMGNEYPHLFGSNINYWDKTWIAFDFDGNISAHISKTDYLDYRINLEFDRLCESLGILFIAFFEDFKRGDEVRIIDKLNEVKVGWFS